jgi:sirohydrochlorin ferrochelatase
MKTALLLIAHGSRHADANADLDHIAGQLRERALTDFVATAFLELASPTIDEAAAECVGQGARRVVLVPYFLSAGIHVKRDLAEFQTRLGQRYPEVGFLLAEPMGKHCLLADVVADRVTDVIRQNRE